MHRILCRIGHILLGSALLIVILPGCTKNGFFNFLNSGNIDLKSVAYNKDEVSKYEMFEATVDFDAVYENPFDQDDISVKAHITTPSGKQITVNGFADYPLPIDKLKTWKEEDNKYAEIPKGEEVFKVRFSYYETGTYKLKLEIRSRDGYITKRCRDFKIVQGNNSDSMWAKGPIERSKTNPNYFSYIESGEDYVPVGYAIAWSWPESLDEFLGNIDLLAESGGNFTRIWGNGINQTLSLETKYFGLGKYQNNHIQAQEIVFNHCRKKNVTIQYSFDSFTSLQSDPKWYGEWHNNPYNSKNGGIIQTPLEFYTDEKAKALFKRKIQYILARWGWDTNITMFELMNEIDGTEPFAADPAAVADWVKEMCRYIKELDYYKRPISVSHANPKGHPIINNLEELDYVITHYYDAENFAEDTRKYVTLNLRNYKKPVLIGEFGPSDKNFEKGSDGLYFQEGLWSSIASGSMMSAQSWWWDSVIEYYGISWQLKPLRKFVDSFEFTRELLEDIKGIANFPNIDVYGRINYNRNRGFAWLHNRDNGWQEIYLPERRGILSDPVRDVKLEFKAENGLYKVDYWDTWSENESPSPVRTENLKAENGKLIIPFDEIYIDTAVMFTKIS